MFITLACKDTNKNKGIRNSKEYFSVEIATYFFHNLRGQKDILLLCNLSLKKK